jgi:pyrimidine-nucleoside phosphorylase
MEEPIGRFVGNALEVRESLDVLEGKGPTDTIALTVELGAEMLVLGGVADDVDDGRARIRKALQDGSARERFGRIIEAQHGDRRVLDDRQLLPDAPHRLDVKAQRAGRVVAVDSESVGIASMVLGGGRARAEDKVDHRVGLELHVRLGDVVVVGQPLVTLHHADVGTDAASDRILRAYVIDDDGRAFSPPPLFGERISS